MATSATGRATREAPDPPAGVHVIRPTGDLDAALASSIRSQVLRLTPGTHLVIDLEGVMFIDSIGVGALIGASRHVARGGGSVVLACPHSPVARVLRLTGLDRILPTVPTKADALRLLQPACGS